MQQSVPQVARLESYDGLGDDEYVRHSCVVHFLEGRYSPIEEQLDDWALCDVLELIEQRTPPSLDWRQDYRDFCKQEKQEIQQWKFDFGALLPLVFTRGQLLRELWGTKNLLMIFGEIL